MTTYSEPPIVIETSWSRQGAANIAGVSYQIAITAFILIRMKLGQMRATAVIPEGDEDIDMPASEGGWMLAQAKERADGKTNLGLADVAKVVRHAYDKSSRRPVAQVLLFTNAHYSKVQADNWSTSLFDQLEPDELAKFAVYIEESLDDATGKARATRIINLPRGIWRQTALLIAEAYGLVAAIAELVYCKLIDELTSMAADQRTHTRENALSFSVTALDALVAETVEVIDVDSLDEAIRDGLGEFVDFRSAATIPVERFLSGVDATPRHIAAGLDLARPEELTSITDGLAEQKYVVILGPSGAGKSTLLWRSAKELSDELRVVRIRRVNDDGLTKLLRWLKVQRPSNENPILVCADNLGDTRIHHWPLVVAALREIDGIRILVAVRQEDFLRSFAVGPTKIVVPNLSSDFAKNIAEFASLKGVVLARTFQEAFSQSEGLLMEFVSLLINSERLEQVVSIQAEERNQPDRATERLLLRYICTSNLLGIQLQPASVYLLAKKADDYHAALSRLKDEHILITTEDGAFKGLHEMRSQVIVDVLHSTPPPTIEETISDLLTLIQTPDLEKALLRGALRAKLTPASLVTSLRNQAFERADAGRARSVLRTAWELESILLARHHRDQIVIPTEFNDGIIPKLLVLVYAAMDREYDLSDEPEFIKIIFDFIKTLPDLQPTLVRQIMEGVDEAAVLHEYSSMNSEKAIEFLQLVEGCLNLSPKAAAAILNQQVGMNLEQRSRLIATLHRSVESPKELPIGTIEQRLYELGQHLANTVETALTNCGAKLTCRIRVMWPEDDGFKAQCNHYIRVGLDLCPEIDVIEVETVDPSGSPITTVGHGIHKGDRSHYAWQRAPETVSAALFFSSLRRVNAANSWTQRLRAESVLLVKIQRLLIQLPERLLARNDNAARRREWFAALEEVYSSSRKIPGLPISSSDPHEPDPVKDSIAGISNALHGLAKLEANPRLWSALAWVSDQLTEVKPVIMAAVQSCPPISLDGENLTLGHLYSEVEQVSKLLLALTPADLRTWDKPGEGWARAAADFAANKLNLVLETERQAISDCFSDLENVNIHHIPFHDESIPRLATSLWLVDVPQKHFEEVEARLATLTQPLRTQLAFRACFSPIFAPGQRFPLAQMLQSDRLAPLINGPRLDYLKSAGWFPSPEDPIQARMAENLFNSMISISLLSARQKLRSNFYDVSSVEISIDQAMQSLRELLANFKDKPLFGEFRELIEEFQILESQEPGNLAQSAMDAANNSPVGELWTKLQDVVFRANLPIFHES